MILQYTNQTFIHPCPFRNLCGLFSQLLFSQARFANCESSTRCVWSVCCALIGSQLPHPSYFLFFFHYLRLSVPRRPREGKKAKVSRMVGCVDADPSTRGSLWISAVMYLQLHRSKGDWRVSSTSTVHPWGAMSNGMPKVTGLLIYQYSSIRVTHDNTLGGVGREFGRVHSAHMIRHLELGSALDCFGGLRGAQHSTGP